MYHAGRRWQENRRTLFAPISFRQKYWSILYWSKNPPKREILTVHDITCHYGNNGEDRHTNKSEKKKGPFPIDLVVHLSPSCIELNLSSEGVKRKSKGFIAPIRLRRFLLEHLDHQEY